MSDSRRKQLEIMLSKYGISLDSDEVAEVLNCCKKKAMELQSSGQLVSYVLDSRKVSKTYKTTKVDIINFMLNNDGEQND